jgi:hypothetical protein
MTNKVSLPDLNDHPTCLTPFLTAHTGEGQGVKSNIYGRGGMNEETDGYYCYYTVGTFGGVVGQTMTRARLGIGIG